jgi:hypothetical protein
VLYHISFFTFGDYFLIHLFMKKNIFLSVLLCLTSALSLSAQHSTAFDADDALGRGYTQRPYLRYEAEQSQTDGTVLQPTFDQRELQSEASNKQAVSLTAVGQSVQWTNDEAADGMTIRFSIPDNAAGTGTVGKVALYVNNVWVTDIELNSRWAWQYFFAINPVNGQQSSYAHNVQSETVDGSFARMRFDEMRVKLAEKIPAGATFKLEKVDAGAGAYTIDFVELEPIPAKEEAPEGAIIYSGDGSDLHGLMSVNPGQTIYVPEGVYNIPSRLYMYGAGQKLIGAGMWYTQLHFTADPNGVGYDNRGIDSSVSNVEINGLYITTENDRRYALYGDNEAQMGKGFSGTFGTGSKISDVWVTHFECGAWFRFSSGLQISNSRFRNNYADGINLAEGSNNATVSQCSFRNNGDDDMASWSQNNRETTNIVYQNNTSENNWRAGGVAFFGGKQNKALNIVIADALEDGIRVSDEYAGAPFSTDGFFEIRNISIYRSGSKAGTEGQSGNLWGDRAAGILLSGNLGEGKYDVQNFIFSDIDIHGSGGDAMIVLGKVNNVFMQNMTVDGAALSTAGNLMEYYGVFMNAAGYNNIFCIDFQNMGTIRECNNTFLPGFLFNTNCTENTVSVRVNQTIALGQFIPETFADNVTYELADGATYASVDAQGMLTGLSEGTAQVKVTDAANPANSLIFTVIVRETAVTGFSLLATLTMAYRESYKLLPIFTPENPTNQTITWTSSDATAVSVTVGGVLQARKLGTVVITATTADGGYTAKCTVTVTEEGRSAVPGVDADGLVISVSDGELTVSGDTEGKIVSVYNTLGVKVYSQKMLGQETVISGLADGIYIVRTENGLGSQKVIIKQ